MAAKHFKGENGGAAPSGADGSRGFIPVVSNGPTHGGREGRSPQDRRVRSGNYRDTDPYDLSGKRSGDPRKRRSRIFSTILFVVGIVLLLTAAGMWGYSQYQYREQAKETEKLAQYATVDDKGNKPPAVDWAALKAINPDVVGWVQIPDTVVSFPVYQGRDNEQYLHTNAEGGHSLGGQIFLDAENKAPGMVDEQTIIYGHHLRNGAMFKPIADMDKQDAFNAVKTIWYVTEDKTYELEPLLLYYTDENDRNVRVFDWSTPEEFHAYLEGLLAKSVTSRPDAAQVIPDVSHVLTLATCNYIDGYGRTILVCVPKGEAGR